MIDRLFLEALIAQLEPKQFPSGQVIHNTGISICVVKNGIFTEHCFGYRDRENKLLVQPDTIFPIASITKSFISTSITQIFNDQKISLDTPLHALMPEIKFSIPFLTDQVNVIDLLAHRVSIPRNDWLWYWGKTNLDKIIQKLPLIELNPPDGSGFRNSFQYNNITYGIAGELIRKIAGVNWEDYLQQKIINPLAMNNTFTSFDAIPNSKHYSLPYFREMQTEILKIWQPSGAGAMWSTSRDIATWLALQMETGYSNNLRIFNSEIFAALWEPHNKNGGAPELSSAVTLQNYGLGWLVDEFAGKKLLHHGGVTNGLSAFAAFLPSEKLGVVVLVNQVMSNLARLIALNILSNMLGKDEKLDRFLPINLFSKDSWQPNFNSPHILRSQDSITAATSLLGQYENPIYGRIEIRKNEFGFELRNSHESWPVISSVQDRIIVGCNWLGMPSEMNIRILENALELPLNLHPGTRWSKFVKVAS